jgi:hypothetical protein
MAQQNTVTKIYRLETIGYNDIHKQFQQLSDDLLKLKKLIVDLQGQRIGLKGDDLAKVNTQIREAVQLHDQLETQLQQTNTQVDNSVSKYAALNRAYREAKENAQDLAAEYGVESEQAKVAAESAAALKQQLTDINNLVKTAGKTQAPVIPLAPVAQAQTINPNLTASEQAIAANKAQEQSMIELAQSAEFLKEKEEELEAARASAAQSGNQTAKVIKDETQIVDDAAASISQVTTKYEEYTGTLRQNIIAQLENNNQLVANRAAQKQLQASIAEQGTATQAQLERMALLVEEEQILIETNKALTLTIRNQTKEFIAGSGSLDEMQAQLNQLQQAYEGLIAVEKASPFGLAMKAEIDVLEPKVKSLEAELGKFQRNVGNYPQIFGGAFKVLENELDIVKGKLIQGNFSGKQLDELTAKEKVLTAATQTLGQSFATTAQEQNAMKEAARQVSTVYGTESAVFKEFSTAVAAGNAQLGAADSALRTAGKSGGTFVSIFKSIFAQLRNLANIIPGAGIGTLVFLLLTPLTSFASSLLTVSKNSKKAKEDLHDYNAELESYNKIIDETNQKTASQLTNLKLLNDQATNSNLPLKERLQAVTDLKNQFPEYFGQLNNELILTGKATEAYKQLAQSIKDAARSEAVKGELTEITKQLLDVDKQRQKIVNATNAEKARAKDETFEVTTGGGLTQGTTNQSRVQTKEEAIAIIDKRKNEAIDVLNKKEKSLNLQFEFVQGFLKTVDKKLPNPNDKLTAGQLQILIDNVNQEISTLKEGEPKLKQLEKERDAFQKRLDAILKKPTPAKASTISGKTKDALADIEAERNQLLAEEGIKRQQNLIDEETYLKNILKINEDAIEKKLALLKGANAAERHEISQLQLERLKIEQDTSDKVFEIRKNALKQQLDQAIQAIRLQEAIVENDPSVSAEKRAQAKLDADNQILDLQKIYNQKIDLLEKQAHLQSQQNAKDNAETLRKLEEDILKDKLNIATATLEDIRAAGAKQRSQFNADFEKLRQDILSNDKLTATQREKALDKLEKTHNLSIAASQAAEDTIAFKKIQEQYAQGLKTEEEFLKAREKMEKSHTEFLKAQKQAQLEALALPSSQNTQKNLQERLSKSFGFTEGGASDQLLGNVIADAFSTAQFAMNAYFDAEQSRIQQSLDLTLKRIDVEKQQAEARAQSQAEIDSIEKQAAAKQKAAQKEAGEQLKKVKKSEAKIALATELANIAVAAASNPLNGLTFGAAGAIMYSILAALALARYAVNVSAINREQFAFGGQPGNNTTNNYYQKVLSSITPTRYQENFAYRGSGNRISPIATSSNDVPTRGGKFGGKPHSRGGTPFRFKGKEYEAEVDELSVIRTKNAPKGKRYTVTGTQSQIASAINVVGGGHDFAPGAQVEEHKNIFTNTIKKIFSYGGNIKEKRTTEKEDNHSSVLSNLVNKIFNEKRELFDTKNVSEIASIVTTRLAENNVRNTSASNRIINKLINEKINSEGVTSQRNVSDNLTNTVDVYRNIIDSTIRENKELADTKNVSEIASLVITKLEKNNETKSSVSKAIVNKLINEKISSLSENVKTKKESSQEHSDSIDHYTSIVDKVINENKDLVETKNSSAIVKKVLSHISDTNIKLTAGSVKTVTSIIEERINAASRKDITDEHTTIFNKTIDEQVTSQTKTAKTDTSEKITDTVDHYQSIIDKVTSENKDLLISKSTSDILTKVVSNITDSRSTVTANTITLLRELVNEKIDSYHNKVFTVTGTTRQIYSSLDMPAKKQFAFGGYANEVPLRGGEFGGQPHSRGGTKFFFNEHQYEAEVKELAVIRTRNADRNKVYTVTGNQMQLASFANVIGGGINFKPGATAKKFASGGVLGGSLQAPIFVPTAQASNNNDALLAELKTLNNKIENHAIAISNQTKATNDRIDRLEVIQVTDTVTAAQKKKVKQNSVGTIP